MLPILWDLWPIWSIFLFLIVLRLILDWMDWKIENWTIHRKFKKGEQWKTDIDLLRWLRGMEPSEFEKYIADLFNRLGYNSEAVGKSHDGGIDVIAEKMDENIIYNAKNILTKTKSVLLKSAIFMAQ